MGEYFVEKTLLSVEYTPVCSEIIFFETCLILILILYFIHDSYHQTVNIWSNIFSPPFLPLVT